MIRVMIPEEELTDLLLELSSAEIVDVELETSEISEPNPNEDHGLYHLSITEMAVIGVTLSAGPQLRSLAKGLLDFLEGRWRAAKTNQEGRLPVGVVVNNNITLLASSDLNVERLVQVLTEANVRTVSFVFQETPKMKIKILFLAANPIASNALQLDEEARKIEEKLRGSKERDRLEFTTKWAVRPDDLQQYLLECQPHVVHFSGHGTEAGELVLQDEFGRPKPVSHAALVALFRAVRDNLRLAVLNACFSQAQAAALADVIDCSVGMIMPIGDRAAIIFASAFYRALGFGRSVQTAFDLGKAALMAEGIPEHEIPELMTREQVDASTVILAA
jgi:hypothetical protein